MRGCELCGVKLDGRADRLYCSPRCRVAAHRAREREARESVQAAALDEVTLVESIAAAGATNWRASAWLLERRWPERWSARPRSEPKPQSSTDANDPFREVDELARQRAARLEPQRH